MSIDIQKAVVGDTARVSRMWVHLALVSGALATAPTFEVVIDRTSASPDNQLPTYNFSVRQFSTAYWPGDSRTYGYADIVPFNDSFYPTSYSSYIGIYSSPDGASRWAYHGLALQHGRPGSIDAGGTATPSVAVTNGTVLLSYAAESQPGGQGTRFIALATASHPLGPFVKAERPLGAYGQCRSDDPQLVVRPGIRSGGCLSTTDSDSVTHVWQQRSTARPETVSATASRGRGRELVKWNHGLARPGLALGSTERLW